MTTKQFPKIQITAEREAQPPGPVFDLYVDGILASATVGGVDSEKLATLLAAAPQLLQVAELAAAFVGMHTSGGVPNEYMGRFESLLNDPKTALEEIQSVIDLAKGLR